MKNFDIMGVAPSPIGIRRIERRQLRRHLGPRRDAPEIADDDAVIRIEAGRMTRRAPQQFAELDIALLDDIVLVHDEQIAAALVCLQSPVGNQQCVRQTLPIGRRIRTKNPGSKVRFGLRKMPRTSNVPVAGSIAGATYSIVPWWGNPVSSDRPTSTGTLCRSARGQAALSEVGADLQHILLAQVGDDIDRVELGDLGEHGLLAGAADKVAGIDRDACPSGRRTAPSPRYS